MTGVVHRSGFAEALVLGGDLDRVARAIVEVVEDSFKSHPMRGGSNRNLPEWSSRRDFVVKTFRELQGDLKWTTDRALSMLRPALAAKLDGRPFHVGGRQERRSLWAPDSALARQDIIRVDDPALAPAGPAGGVESLEELKAQLKAGLDIDADGD